MKLGIQGGMVAEGSGVPLLALKTAFCVQIRQAGIAQELDTPRKPQPGFHGERQNKQLALKTHKKGYDPLSVQLNVTDLLLFLRTLKYRKNPKLKIIVKPWMVWLSGLSTSLQTKGFRSGPRPELQARSPAGRLRQATNQCLSLSLSLYLSLPPFPSL